MLRRDLYNRRVEDVMSKVEWTVEPLDPLSEALGKMKKFNVKELPVVERGKLKGLLTFRTITRRRKMAISAHVKGFMISPPKVKSTDKIHKVAEWLITRDFSSLPVTHKTDVLGMISRKDIIKILREDEELRNTQVESIMNFAPTTIDTGLGMRKALTLIDLAGDTSAAVVDEEKRFLGTISTKDLVTYLEAPRRRPSKGDFQGEKVHRDRSIDSLTEMPQALLRTDPLSKLMDIMVDQEVDTVYVLDGDELAGSINEVDLLELFMRGPSRGGPLIQVAGIDDVKLMDASELDTVFKKFSSRIEKFTQVSAITIRIRHHHHDTDEDKYTVNVKLTTPTEVISREAYDWDLLVAIGNAFIHIEQQLKKEKSKAQKGSRKHG